MLEFFKEPKGNTRRYQVTPDGDVILVDDDGGGGSYTPQGPTSFGVGGISSGTDLGTDPITVQALLDMMLYGYIAASISLAAVPSVATLREVGNTLASAVLNATTVKHSNDITAVTFFRGASLINTVASPNPAGGLESFTENTPITTNTTFTAKVFDGVTLVTSNTQTYTFVPAYYYGVGDPGLDGTQIAALTKDVIANTPSVARDFSPSTQVYYFAYPSTYPVLTSILDDSGFETISDWTVRTVSITNGFGDTRNYRVYEFNNVTTQTNFTNTFIQ